MGDTSPDRKSGCGLLNAVLGRRNFWQRRATSTGSLPTASNGTLVKTPSTPNSKRRRGGSGSGSDEAAFLGPSMNVPEAHQKPITRAPNHPKIPPAVYQQPPVNVRRNPDHESNRISPNQGYVNQGRRVPKEAIGISGELESVIADHQKSKGSNTLVRASSGNVMLMGNLGNLRQPGGGGGGGGGRGNTNSYNVLDHLPKTAREETTMPYGRYPNSVMGNVVKKTNEAEKPKEEQSAGSLCRAISTRMDPEQLKIMGNEDYKNGNFAEALALYDAAISIDPNKASYRSNKSAALTALGRILDAVFECREAIRIDPRYHRAHHRLANLYLRLGEAEKAIYHYKHAGPEADHIDISKAKTLQAHLSKCTEARRLRDWNTLIKETANTMSAGADSAPQIYALQAEALLKLHRHQEADDALTKGPNFEVDACTKFFGPIGNANLLVVRAQVDLAVGRFDDALASAQRAARLDSNNKEVNMVMRRARAVGAARSNGNEHFKASKYKEACGAYGEGLDHDPYNSVLLCNRAACKSKLGHYEKAVEDCTAALNVRPNYSKARLRRADCNAKLGRWEASIQDYEVLQKETPEDEEIKRALSEAQAQLKKRRGV
ncbi:putative Tetratricopeptide repeat protein [Tripterygium wilfordii]|uniref:Putative Tetratricopeptide repeat protein n=1 Tax=Tripterygium wilfordii TaxID=458696 RepID=A0A7J7DTW5_TRIWF|nr:inactive TPR repeat-containing thioredoxin TTL3-like [Tripterygium wilfordii]KAF5749812.1 putative Tetratricopeptide repeat protein [Tripterygium wilfordii]